MTTTNRPTPINKLEAARRQINCAVRIFLNGEDILAVHTLAYAAFGILMDYDRKTNRGCVWASIQRKLPDDWSRDLANFLKHADRDPHREIPSYPEFLSVYLLHMGGRIYAELHDDQATEEMKAIAFFVHCRLENDREAEKAREKWEYTEDDELEELHQEEIRQKAMMDQAIKKVALDMLHDSLPF